MLLGTHDMRPTFFIGLGGSGGRVVDVLASRLQVEPKWPQYEGLIHFVCVDTDENDLKRLKARMAVSSISIREKPRRIALLRGEGGDVENRRVTSWVHPWYGFREVSSAGAGQIRLESRFSLHCQLAEATQNSLRQIISRQLRRALRPQEAHRGQGAVRFFIYGSIAGGTGSGASLSCAYLLRSIAQSHGAPAEVYGCFFLPSLFRSKVQGPLISKINANGYAALKEIERFMELRYEGGPGEMELVFDPGLSDARTPSSVDRVSEAPFDWIYLVDRPEAMSIEQIYAAVGEAAYFQLFSPILGFQERAADNYRQLQTELARGAFALQYGSIGASVLELPRRRLLRYFARRWTIERLERLIIARRAQDEGMLDPRSPEFKALSDGEQSKRLDQAFCRYVELQARREEQEAPGIFSEIRALSSGGTALIPAFRELLLQELKSAEAEIEIESINSATLTMENISLNAARNNFSRDFARSRQRLSARAEILEREISDGRLLGEFFKQHKVSPLTQRYLLIELDRLAREELQLGEEEGALIPWCFNPYEESEAGRFLAEPPIDPGRYKIESPEVQKMIAGHERGLVEVSRKRFGLFQRERAFMERRQSVISFFNALSGDAWTALILDFWQQISRALQGQIEQRLDLFRSLAKQGVTLVAHLREQAEVCRKQGDEVPEVGQSVGETQEFHLGEELFYEARRGRRQWDRLYHLLVEGQLGIGAEAQLAKVNQRLQEGSQGRTSKARLASRTLEAIARDLDKLARDRLKILLAEQLDLGKGLILEARLALSESPKPDRAELERVDPGALRDYLSDKLRRVILMSRPLGRFDAPVLAGAAGNVKPYPPLFYGVQLQHLEQRLDPEERGGEACLADLFAEAAEGFERVEDWDSPDLVSFYQGRLGLPLYGYLDILGPLQDSYDHEVQRSGRSQPLHIDGRWEREGFRGAQGLGLPDLDPLRRQRWDRMLAERQAHQEHSFARCLAAEIISWKEEHYLWSHRGHSEALGVNILEALRSFEALSEHLRGPLLKAAEARLAEDGALIPRCLESLAGLAFDREAKHKKPEAVALQRLSQLLEEG